MKADPFTKFPFQNELLNIIKNLVPLHSVYLISFEKEKQNDQFIFCRTHHRSQSVLLILSLL